MRNRISFISIRQVAKGIVDLLHNKPAADVELRKAEAQLKRAEAELKRSEAEDKKTDAKLKEANSNYVNAKAQQEYVKKYFLLDQLMDRMGMSKEERRDIILRGGPKCQEALEQIYSLNERGRILSVQLNDAETRQFEEEDNS